MANKMSELSCTGSEFSQHNREEKEALFGGSISPTAESNVMFSICR